MQDIEFDEKKTKKLFKKPTKRKRKRKEKNYYNDYYNSDEADVNSDVIAAMRITAMRIATTTKVKMRKSMPERKKN